MTHSEALERAIQIVEAYIASHTDPDPSFGTVKVAKETLEKLKSGMLIPDSKFQKDDKLSTTGYTKLNEDNLKVDLRLYNPDDNEGWRYECHSGQWHHYRENELILTKEDNDKRSN